MKKTKAFSLLKLLRPKQWIKNFFVFAAIVFGGQLLDAGPFTKTLFAFMIFCAVSSAIYIINDILDIKKDRLHPFKKYRPLASGALSIHTALVASAILIIISVFTSSLVTPAFFAIIVVYVIFQISYSAYLKHVAIIDILMLAAGYIIRVLAGEFATGYHISVWLLLTTISVSLFLASGKRRQELTLISKYPAQQIAATRKSLSHYSERLLDVYIAMFATSTFITYSFFTFFQDQTGFKPSLGILFPDYLPTFLTRKWLMITILPVVYGLMRYLQDIYEKHEGESPEKVFLSDRPFFIAILIWVFLVVFVTYFINPAY